MKHVVLHIDRLVLRGIGRTDAAAVSTGIQAELQRLLAEPDAATSLAEGGHRYRIKAGTVNIAQDADGRAVGHAIAGGVFKGVSS